MNKRIFGFDLGVASIGWAVVDLNDEDYNIDTGEVIEGKLIDCGVKTFIAAESPDKKESLAKPRRDARLKRRTTRRRARRVQGIKNLFVTLSLTSLDELENAIEKQSGGDVWHLRVKALSEKLEKLELLRVLIHLAKHRGFKSYRRAFDENDKDSGKVLTAIKANLDNKEGSTKYLTFAQMIVDRAEKDTDDWKKNTKRNTNKNNYMNSIPRDEIIKELDLIYNEQKQYGIFTEKLLNDYKLIAFRHRDISSVGKMVGKCLFEKDEKRAAKQSLSAELFVALTKINNCKVIDDKGIRNFTDEEREETLKLLKTQKKVTYLAIINNIFQKADITFKDIDYSKNTKIVTKKDTKEKVKENINPLSKDFYSMQGYHMLNDAIDISKYSTETLDKVVFIIATEKSDKNIREELNKLNISDGDIEKLSRLSFSKFINLSFKALYKILPLMQKGNIYNVACDAVGYDFQSTGEACVEKYIDSQGRSLLKPLPQDKLTNSPIVNRTLAQFRKIYNAMVRAYGEPDQINIETGKELKYGKAKKDAISKAQAENAAINDEAKKMLNESGLKENYKNITKFKLWNIQNGKCIYSGKNIEYDDLFKEGNCEVDHILPRSRSQDNSFNNLALCLYNENQYKGNKTPYEYFGGDYDRWQEFEIKVNSMKSLGLRRISNLLNKTFGEEELGFIARNSNDNSYIARYVRKYCIDGIDFSRSKFEIKDRVQARSGSMTASLRGQWGLVKNRAENDKHHAQDAIVIACSTQKMVSYISSIESRFENKYELINKYGKAWYESFKERFKTPTPWLGFVYDVSKALEDVFVARTPRRKATGELHAETIKSLKEDKPKTFIEIRGGKAENGNMFRTDVFTKMSKTKKERFHLVPIYLLDVAKGVLPNKTIGGELIDETFSFKFSIHMDDLIEVKKGAERYFGYFGGTDVANGVIKLFTPDRSAVNDKKETYYRVGVKTVDSVKKFAVDYLGKDIREVVGEKKLDFSLKKTK